jgi:dihydrolipoamide dehydrogenase
MRKLLPKLLVVGVLGGIAVAFFAFDLKQYLSLEYLKAQQGNFRAFYETNRFMTLGAFFAVYVVTTALSLPGAAILTLAAGALFGVATGTVVVSFASSLGATCAFLASRFLMRDYVQSKFGDKLRAINEGIKKEGSFYLFTLRLIPLFPFFVINLVMGLTPVSALRFYWVSQLGMLPGTLVFVNAGTQLSQITSLKGILSGKILFSFVLLGVFPLVAKKVIDRARRSKTTKKYPVPRHYDYNLVVIGAGSAGLVTSYIAAAVKAKVALIEKHKMGGDCLNTGCVPSKALIRSAKILAYAKRAREFGFKSGKFEFEFSEIMERVQRVIQKVAPHDSVERYTQLGVDCIEGTAKITSPYTVEVGGRTLTTKNIVVATGGRPAVPPLPGIEKINYLTSDNIWELRTQPKKMVVLGGGPIGSEIAQCFARFGTEVTIVQGASRVLPREDDEVADLIMNRFREEGITLLLDHKAKSFKVEGNKKFLICEKNGQETAVEFDEILIGAGRKANVTGFGLEDLGVKIAPSGTVEIDEFLRTNYPNIYVCGDVAGPYQFTHFSAHQAWYAAVNALFSPLVNYKADYRVIPWVTYTDPEVARVGLNEKEAKEKNIPYEVSVYGLDDLDRAIAEEEDHGFVKVLTVPGKDKILGVTVVGSHAGDYFIEFVAAMKHGYGLNKILGTIHPYPTFSEANKYVAGVWKKNHAPEKLLGYVKRYHEWRRGGAGRPPEAPGSQNQSTPSQQRRAV